MWIADNWKDYEVLDASGGEKLERWGEYVLVRPDPQVLWSTPRKHIGWQSRNAHYHRSAKGGGEWEFFRLTASGGLTRGAFIILWEIKGLLWPPPTPFSPENAAVSPSG